MTDRELLEAAAKSAGMTVQWDHYAGDGESGAMVTADGYAWSPLTDDGDALRLAVKLNIDASKPGMRLSIDWQAGADPYAATRRAVVRAAAAMKEKT